MKNVILRIAQKRITSLQIGAYRDKAPLGMPSDPETEIFNARRI